MAKTLEELEAEAQAAQATLEAARQQAIEDAKLTVEEAQAIVESALAAHGEAETDEQRHAIAAAALAKLEAGGVKGPAVDLLAQHVVDARGA